MIFQGHQIIHPGGKLDALKCARMQSPPIDLNLGLPFGVSFAPRNTFIARRIIFLFSSIATILMRIGFSQVLPAVIIWNMIPVVYFLFWPLAGHVEPRKLMCIIVPSIDFDSARAITTD